VKAIVIGLIVVLVLVVAGVVGYQIQPVTIESKTRVVCKDPEHQGDRFLREKVETISCARKNVERMREREEPTQCALCEARATAKSLAEYVQQERAKKLAEEKKEREERLAREREEAERLFSTLEVEFGPQEVSLLPGHDIMPKVSVKNRGKEPISDLRFVLEDEDKCLVSVMPDWHAFGLDEKDLRAKEESNKRFNEVLRKAFNDLFGRGVPICVGDLSITGSRHSTTLRPYGVHDPYRAYTEDVGGFSGYVQLEKPFIPVTGVGEWPPVWTIQLSPHLILREGLAGGQDKRISGYLIYKGTRRRIGTLTVHVMYSEIQKPVVGPTVTAYDCGRNLSNIRGTASYVHIMEGRYPPLAELRKKASMKCPVSGRAYVYDQNAGKVRCPSHKEWD